jgi:hypothetical protein
MSPNLWLNYTVVIWPVFGLHKNRERERFYLLPGMGGRAFRRKYWTFFWWSVATGLLVSAALAIALYLIASR